MFRKALVFPCALIAGTSYLSATLDSSFAIDRPLRTLAVVLLLSGFAIIAHGVLASRFYSPQLNNSYTAIPLSDGNGNGNGRMGSRDASPLGDERKGLHERRTGTKALAGLLLLLVLTIWGRAMIHQRIVKDVECTAPTSVALLPLILAIFHAWRGSDAQLIMLYRNAKVPLLERAMQFACHESTRYVLPSFLTFVSSLWVTSKTNALRSTYICPLVNSTTSVILWLQSLGFLFDVVILLVLYRLLSEGSTNLNNIGGGVKYGYKIHAMVGSAFVISALELLGTGVVAYLAFPEHREWLMSPSPEYTHALLVLSFVVSCTIVSFLNTVQLHGVMNTSLIVNFSAVYAQIFQVFRTGVAYEFPPLSTSGTVLSLMALTIALTLQLIASNTTEGHGRHKVPFRLGRQQAILVTLVLSILLVFGLSHNSTAQSSPVTNVHPITTLIRQASVTHKQWSAQAHASRSPPEAIRYYRERYSRDPPPGFDKWFRYATLRNSLVIDDFDNIEDDLAPFSSLSPAELRRRTAQILAENNGLGGISIRSGRAKVFTNVPGTHRWLLDGAIRMIEKFVEHLPDMDLAMNLNDECRVAVPFANLQEALTKRERYSKYKSLKPSIDFSANRSSTWTDLADVPKDTTSYLRDVGFNPTFKLYGSVACPPDSPARRERHSKRNICTSCAAPHSMGVFISNWSASSSPCHQPDIANLHGFHLSPSAFGGTNELMPIFSQSRASGYADIRYPSPGNYMDKTKYEVNDQFPDNPFAKKENTLFWRGKTTEGVSAGSGAWKGMLRQRLVHLLNNETRPQVILLPHSKASRRLNYIMEPPEKLKRHMSIKVDVGFVGEVERCGGADCTDQALEFYSQPPVNFKQHWAYRYLFDADGAGFSDRFIPFLQSNSVVFKSALFREWYEGRLTAWKHFVPVDLRLHDLWSSVAYFGGYGDGKGGKRMIGTRDEAEDIARESAEWARKVLRKEDMEIYFFRLLLEWGRLTDDNRGEVGYRLQEV
ncbi:glycosyltransferase family 90 protein [Pleomassaria siparia CBS 279.74]|uniref:Glycosyltransferase family 90 protein n=1 Tax=Pleomassaria siparia CBS 279.74 TaxID=1314801 RepID=A0A6G1KNY7_9PLEO|nr:glycosyltransferase family 90 protein [Pleomassaria siparia CBS 279.74]